MKARRTPPATDVLAWLERHGTPAGVQAHARFGIVADLPYGIPFGQLKAYAREIGPDHALALKLWAHGRYEARMLATLVDDAAQVTAAQMDAWARAFDNWGIVDTACFTLFDRAPDRWKMVPRWAGAKAEFTKRAAFALLWALALHDKAAPDDAFLRCLPLVEKAADDDRNFVKKAVDMALRALGLRGPVVKAAAIETATRLAARPEATPRWIGRQALRKWGVGPVTKRAPGKSK